MDRIPAAPITADAPTSVAGFTPVAAVAMKTTGTLSGYGNTAPRLFYSFDGNRTRNHLPGVTADGWDAIVMAPQHAGTYSLTIFDGVVTGAVEFTVVSA